MFTIFKEEKVITTGILVFLGLSILVRLLLAGFYHTMIKETDNMATTNNRLLKQCKVKFANCYQLNGGVSNIPVFVDKFLNRLAFGHLSFDAWYHLSGQCMLFSIVFAGIGIWAATAKGLGLALNLPLVEVPTLEGLAFNLWGTDKLVCPIMDARRNQVYTGIYEFCKEEIPEKESSEHQLVMHSIKEQCAIAVDELVEELNRLGREVIFLGDGVPVYREQILQKLKVPCSFAPAANNRQRAASVASLGAVYYAHGRTVTAAEHEPEYLRKSQAEREREEQEKAAKEAQA